MMLRNLLILALILLCLVLLFYPSGNKEPLAPVSPSESSTNPQFDELFNRIEALESDLDSALLARQQLEKRIQLLERSSAPAPGAAPTEAEPTVGLDPASSSETEETPSSVEAPAIEQNLRSAGFSSTLIDQIRQRVDENRLERLQWRDRAIREGWQQSEEFAERMFEFSDPLRGIREEFGDEVYDQYLHASGQPNRVRVIEVLQGSAAEMAGVTAGDIVISYANQPVYTMRSIRQATTEGLPGEPILVELQRDGAPFTVTVPRGPLGISMESTRLEP